VDKPDFIDAVLHLWSFSHTACDTAIESTTQHFSNRFSDLSLYGGLPFITVWVILLLRPVVLEYFERRKQGLHMWPYRIILPPLARGIAVVFWRSQASTIIEYVSTCRSLLNLQ
jgi:hypothetical protein